VPDEEHLQIIRQGVDAWNQWRQKNPGIKVNLREANLRQADLTGANLSVADLRKVNLQEANLEKANLNGAQLIGTDLCDATLTGSYVYGVSVWDIKVNVGTKQQNLIVTDRGKPVITVDNIKVGR
jgi:uncharacterized protein YjbI with pentapeptide repeats